MRAWRLLEWTRFLPVWSGAKRSFTNGPRRRRSTAQILRSNRLSFFFNVHMMTLQSFEAGDDGHSHFARISGRVQANKGRMSESEAAAACCSARAERDFGVTTEQVRV